MADIAKRLRKRAPNWNVIDAENMLEAATRIEALEAENRQLRAALLEQQAKPVQDQDVEDAIEAAYWKFDCRRSGLNEWSSAPQSERDAFKAEARKLVRGYFPTRQAQDTKREMLAVADAFIRGKRAALTQQAERDALRVVQPSAFDPTEALRLADECESLSQIADAYSAEAYEQAAAELRRQHAEIEQLKAERDALRADAGRWAPLLHAAGRVLQAVDDGYLQPDPETLQGSIAIDALHEAWGTFAPARIKRGSND